MFYDHPLLVLRLIPTWLTARKRTTGLTPGAPAV